MRNLDEIEEENYSLWLFLIIPMWLAIIAVLFAVFFIAVIIPGWSWMVFLGVYWLYCGYRGWRHSL